jgi:hypothetical protein
MDGKNMKRRKLWVSILVLVLAVLIVGAVWGIRRSGQKEQADQTSEPLEWYLDYGMNCYSSIGCLYAEEGYLYFLDAETGENLLICDDPTCSHEKPECSAYFDAMVLGGIVEDDKLLLLTDYGADQSGELYLYETALNGSGRKKIAKLSDNIQCILGAEFTEDYIVISFYNQYDENMELLDVNTAGIYVYDRKEETGETVAQVDMWNALAYFPTIVDDQVYFEVFGYDMDKEEAVTYSDDSDYYSQHLVCKLCRCDLKNNDNDNTDIFLTEIEDMTPIVVYQDTFLFRKDDQLYAYSIVDGTTESVGTAMTIIPGDGRDGIYLSKYNSEDSSYMMYLYDGKVSQLGAYASEWVVNAIYGDTACVYRVDPATYIGELEIKTLAEVLE